MTKPPKPTVADLRRKVTELEAQMPSTYHFAKKDITKAGDALMASGVVVYLHALGGRELVKPFCIKDGLSTETISALLKDIQRSLDQSVTWQ